MRFIITETKLIKENCMETDTGYDIMGDLIADSGMQERVSYDDDSQAYRISQKDFDWWGEFFDNAQADEAEFDAMCNRYGRDVVDDVLQRHQVDLWGDGAYEMRHVLMQNALFLLHKELGDGR